MTGEPDKKGGSSEKFSEQIRGAQRLASLLQRAVRSGRTTRSEMRAVDRHISSYLTSKTANILDIIDSLQNGSRSARSKEMMGQLYIDVMRVFGESQSLESHGYSSLIQADGKIDSDKLDELIDLDSEMSSYTAGLERVIVSVENRNGVSNGEYLQIRQFIDIILELLERRRVLVESG